MNRLTKKQSLEQINTSLFSLGCSVLPVSLLRKLKSFQWEYLANIARYFPLDLLRTLKTSGLI